VEHTQTGRIVDRLDRQVAACSSTARRQWSGPRGEIGWIGLLVAGSLRVVGWRWPAGDFVQAWQASVVSSHNLLASGARTTPPKNGPPK
jgi:hypothetical protein